jgi:hypothetical protein
MGPDHPVSDVRVSQEAASALGLNASRHDLLRVFLRQHGWHGYAAASVEGAAAARMQYSAIAVDLTPPNFAGWSVHDE